MLTKCLNPEQSQLEDGCGRCNWASCKKVSLFVDKSSEGTTAVINDLSLTNSRWPVLGNQEAR